MRDGRRSCLSTRCLLILSFARFFPEFLSVSVFIVDTQDPGTSNDIVFHIIFFTSHRKKAHSKRALFSSPGPLRAAFSLIGWCSCQSNRGGDGDLLEGASEREW